MWVLSCKKEKWRIYISVNAFAKVKNGFLQVKIIYFEVPFVKYMFPFNRSCHNFRIDKKSLHLSGLKSYRI
jgi:hypothetical protein